MTTSTTTVTDSPSIQPPSTEPQSPQLAALARGFGDFDLRVTSRDGVSLGYRVAGDGPPVVLVHGYPQSGLSWSAVAHDLVRDHRVVVPDYRGSAGSDVPDDGYDKETMARDLAAVVDDAGIDAPHVVGHDFGMMIGYTYARLFPDRTRTLTVLDAIIPGIPSFQALIGAMGLWHFGFNGQVDLAAALVTGRERTYFDWYFDNFCADPSVIGEDDRNFYADAGKRPGAVLAGLRLYGAAAGADAEANAAALAEHGKLTLPVLGLGGAYSTGSVLDSVLTEVATDTRVISVDGAGHFLPEEAPQAVAAAVRTFVAEHS